MLLQVFSFEACYCQEQAFLENEHFKVLVNSQGAIALYDKHHAVEWKSEYTGWVGLSNSKVKERISLSTSHFETRLFPDSVKFIFQGINGEKIEDPSFQMSGKIIIEEDRVELEIINVETRYSLEEVEYPAHLLNVATGTEDGYIVVPHLQGILIPSRYDVGFMRYGQNIWDVIVDQETWWNFESGNLNMPWYGASKANSSVLATLLTSSDATLHMIGNAVVDDRGLTVDIRSGQPPGRRLSSLTPIWKSSKGELSYTRKLRLEFVENGYVGMAKRYKQYAKVSGRYVTLKEKIISNPEIDKIIGAPDIKIYCYTNRLNKPYLRSWSEPVLDGYSKVNTTFKQVEKIIDDLDSMGVEKCLILLAGWNRMGYDREHVDMWPPAEEAGGIKGLADAGRNAISNGYLFALHDNYDDFYPDAPTFDERFILRDEDGSLHQGGVWDGGPCYIICPSQRVELLNRNLNLIERSVQLNAYYFDVITNTSHYECYDPQHPMNRTEDLQYRLSLLKNVRERGLVLGGERGTDWAIPEVAFCEGLSGGGTGYHRGIAYRTGLTVPLFYLVYRECVVGYWQHGTPYGREDHANHLLLDLLYGQPSSWSLEYAQWEDLKPMIRETYELLGRLHEKTAHAAMTDHRFITVDRMVQRSVFSDGTEIWVNFGIRSFNSDGIQLPPKGFRVNLSGERIKEGVVSRFVEYFDN